MSAINSIIIEGNLVRKPDFKTTSHGTPLCVFSIANNRFFTRNGTMEQETSFFDVETWAELANKCYQNGEKGAPVRVVGRIKQYRWKNAAGRSCSAIRVVAEHVEFKKRTQLETEVDDMVEESEPNEAAIMHKLNSAAQCV